MTWTIATDVKTRLQHLWNRGDLLRDAVAGITRFPLRLPLKGPTSADITDRLGDVRAWVSGLADVDVLRLEWRDVHHRVQGLQQIPSAAWIDSPATSTLPQPARPGLRPVTASGTSRCGSATASSTRRSL